ncbi:GNAT family N-acetyltransferase [Paracoccus aminophilus]|nr:GNAT family N-acetyltransferase [Paracoccus aminophilus]
MDPKAMPSDMNPTFSLRPALPEDAATIAEIWHISASLPGVGAPIMPSRETLNARVAAELPAWQVTLAESRDQILGFIALKPSEKVLAELFLRPEARGLGIGPALIALAFRDMPEGFTLLTSATNTRARRFYERAGLSVLREDTHPRGGHPVIFYHWQPGEPSA